MKKGYIKIGYTKTAYMKIAYLKYSLYVSILYEHRFYKPGYMKTCCMGIGFDTPYARGKPKFTSINTPVKVAHENTHLHYRRFP